MIDEYMMNEWWKGCDLLMHLMTKRFWFTYAFIDEYMTNDWYIDITWI